MLSEFSIAIKYDQFPNYHKFLIILSVYLNILRFHNNASIVKFTGVQGLQEIKGPGI